MFFWTPRKEHILEQPRDLHKSRHPFHNQIFPPNNDKRLDKKYTKNIFPLTCGFRVTSSSGGVRRSNNHTLRIKR